MTEPLAPALVARVAAELAEVVGALVASRVACGPPEGMRVLVV